MHFRDIFHIRLFLAWTATALLFMACGGPEQHFDIPPPQNEVATHGLKGKVRSVTETNSVFQDSTTPPRSTVVTYEFNAVGQLLLHSSSVKGEYHTERTFVYDSLHRKQEYIRASPDLGLHEKEITLYGSHGLAEERQIFNQDGELLEKGTFSYNEDGKLSLRRQFLYARSPDGERETEEFKVEYEYDGEGKLQRKVSENGEHLLKEEVYENGKLVEVKGYQVRTGKPSSTTRFHYTDSSTVDSTWLADGSLFSVRRQLKDSLGQVTTLIHESLDVHSTSQILKTYNAQGDLASQTELYSNPTGNPDGDLMQILDRRYSYEYDVQGNWTHRVAMQSGRVEEESRREILYW